MSNKVYDETIKWLRSGKIGCTFATTFAREPEKIGWKFQINPDKLEWDKDTYLLSIIFPDGDIHLVKQWALDNGMYLEDIEDLYQGLRLKIGRNISWVQYFGPDSHVKTRLSPYPMLNLCVKVSKFAYTKVGYNGVLHLAHVSVENLKERVQNLLWGTSHTMTANKLGHKPTIKEAAKTTYIK